MRKLMTDREKEELITKIRDKYLGTIDFLTQKNREFLEDHNSMLKQLSGEDLYSNKFHFLLELLQNADDNRYDEDVYPRLKFRIYPDKLIIQNNEKGFSTKDVKAICRMGYSEKKNLKGFIGDKGIGFKSVFSISNVPEIHSNGFHFKFDKKEQLGLVNPIWAEENLRFIDNEETNIIIPYNNPRSVYPYLKTEFNKIKHELLLFLNKLNILEIIDVGTPIIFSKINEKGKIISINDKKWKVIKKEFKIENILEESKRKNIDVTEIVLAFPLDNEKNVKHIPNSLVFAYFPIKSFGFKFIIHADFQTVTNRENLPEDNSWNLWLIKQLQSVMIAAIEDFKNDDNLKFQFYKYFPTKSVIEPPFTSFMEDLYNKLRDYNCILSEDSKWEKPSKVKIINPKIRKLFPKPEEFYSIFDVDYKFVEDKTISEESKNIFEELNIQEFSFHDLCRLLENYNWIKEQDKIWFLGLFKAFIEQFKKEIEVIDNIKLLKKLKIFKVQNGQVLAPAENKIYFKTDSYYGFERIFNILPKEFDNKEFELFFKSLGIQELSTYEINDFIKKLYQSKKWVDFDEDFLTNIIIYLKDKHNEGKFTRKYGTFTVEEVENFIVFKTKNQKKINPKDNQGHIFLPEEYCDNKNLANLFKEIENLDYFFISEDYIKLDVKRNNINNEEQFKKLKDQWVEFFDLFEIASYFIPITKEKSEEFHPAERFTPQSFISFNLTDQEINKISKRSNYTTQVLVDFKIPQLNKIINHIIDKNDEDRAKNLLFALNELFISRYRKKISLRNYIEHIEVYHRWFLGIFSQSTTKRKLNGASWIKLLYNNSIVPTQFGLQQPTKVFFSNLEIVDLIGEEGDLPILSKDIQLDDEFLKVLGINQKLDTDSIIKLLKNCKNLGICSKEKYLKIYRYLNDILLDSRFRQDEIIKEFNDNSLIFAEKSQSFFTLQELIWEDKNEIVGKFSKYSALKDEYPNLKELFVDRLEIAISENDLLNFNLLKEISEKKSTEITEEIVQQAFRIYKCVDYLENIDDLAFIVSYNGNIELRKNECNIYINDKDPLYNLFKTQDDIYFLNIGHNSYIEISNFLYSAKIKYISKEVKIEAKTIEYKNDLKKITYHITFLLQLIKWYLYYTDYAYFTSCIEQDLFNEFNKTKCVSTSNLEILYSLNGVEIVEKALIFHDKYNNIIYIDNILLSHKTEIYDKIAVIIDEYFDGCKIDDTISLFFRFRSKNEIENYFNSKNMPPLLNINVDYSYLGEEDGGDADRNGDDDKRGIIGYQGEENAFRYFIKRKKEEYKTIERENFIYEESESFFGIKKKSQVILKASWLNYPFGNDQRKPFDIEFMENSINYYIEVKSTSYSGKQWFQISDNEWDKLIEEGERYYIYRVYNVVKGKKDNNDIRIVHNPVKQWKEGKINAYPYKIEI